MEKILIFWMLILSANFCSSQISGRCIDAMGNPISYANVGVLGSNRGTVTNSEGVFVLDDNFITGKHTIVVSYMGYETKLVDIDKNTKIEIMMKPLYYELEEVKIGVSTNKFTKEKRIGNNVLTEHVIVGFYSQNMGAEIGKFFKVNRGEKYKVERIHFNIAELGYKKGMFRINFYKVLDDDTIETERFNDKDIIMEVLKTGDVDVDVTNQKLVFDNDFLVSIECVNYIENSSVSNIKKKRVGFSSNVFCGPFYVRGNHLAKWMPKKQKYNSGLGMQLFVKY